MRLSQGQQYSSVSSTAMHAGDSPIGRQGHAGSASWHGPELPAPAPAAISIFAAVTRPCQHGVVRAERGGQHRSHHAMMVLSWAGLSSAERIRMHARPGKTPALQVVRSYSWLPSLQSVRQHMHRHDSACVHVSVGCGAQMPKGLLRWSASAHAHMHVRVLHTSCTQASLAGTAQPASVCSGAMHGSSRTQRSPSPPCMAVAVRCACVMRVGLQAGAQNSTGGWSCAPPPARGWSRPVNLALYCTVWERWSLRTPGQGRAAAERQQGG